MQSSRYVFSLRPAKSDVSVRSLNRFFKKSAFPAFPDGPMYEFHSDKTVTNFFKPFISAFPAFFTLIATPPPAASFCFNTEEF